MTLPKHLETSEFSKTHPSVLLHEVLEYLEPVPGDVVVDATVGGAGHLAAFSYVLGAKGILIGIDADEHALERAKERLGETKHTLHLVHGNFRNIKTHLAEVDVKEVDHMLFDLGWSAFQLSDGRGFSFKQDEPLKMTYATNDPDVLTAYDLVHTLDEIGLADIIFAYGEERFAKRIARGIVEARKEKEITTAKELAEVVKSSVPGWYRNRKTHPATKTFQALRIAVNDELDALRDALEDACTVLASGGKIAVITFHSVEDRIVKRTFERWVRAGEGTLATKKPITPSQEELTKNPRARSAKLRIFQKNI